MSALDVFTKRLWFRRLWLIAVGILLGLGYFYGFIDDLYKTPALLGILIGILSHKILWGVINSLIIMFSMIFAIVIVVLSGNLGSGDPVIWEMYRDLIGQSFVAGAMPMVALVPCVFIGYAIRFLFLYLRDREKSGAA